MQTQIEIGQTLTCAETGKQFIAARDGISTNYARNSAGEVFSDEGVHIRECRELLDRSKPFGCYVSSDTKHVTGWKGNVLGTIIRSTHTRSGFGANMLAVSVRDVHGNYWHGRGAGAGMCITLRASKHAPK